MKKLLVRGKKGFTLIELLIVIAIIAILATIIILNVLSARAKANSAKVLSELTSSAKVASICLVEEGLLYYDYAAGGEFDVATSNPLEPSTGICGDSTKSPGLWPQLEGIKGTGGTYYQPAGNYIDATKSDFNIDISDDNTGPFAMCGNNGCQKIQ